MAYLWSSSKSEASSVGVKQGSVLTLILSSRQASPCPHIDHPFPTQRDQPRKARLYTSPARHQGNEGQKRKEQKVCIRIMDKSFSKGKVLMEEETPRSWKSLFGDEVGRQKIFFSLALDFKTCIVYFLFTYIYLHIYPLPFATAFLTTSPWKLCCALA